EASRILKQTAADGNLSSSVVGLWQESFLTDSRRPLLDKNRENEILHIVVTHTYPRIGSIARKEFPNARLRSFPLAMAIPNIDHLRSRRSRDHRHEIFCPGHIGTDSSEYHLHLRR